MGNFDVLMKILVDIEEFRHLDQTRSRFRTRLHTWFVLKVFLYSHVVSGSRVENQIWLLCIEQGTIVSYPRQLTGLYLPMGLLPDTFFLWGYNPFRHSIMVEPISFYETVGKTLPAVRTSRISQPCRCPNYVGILQQTELQITRHNRPWTQRT